MTRAREQGHIFSHGLKVMLRRDQFPQHLYGSGFLSSITQQHGRIKGLGGDGGVLRLGLQVREQSGFVLDQNVPARVLGMLGREGFQRSVFRAEQCQQGSNLFKVVQVRWIWHGKNGFCQREDRIIALRTQRGLERGFHQGRVALGFWREGGQVWQDGTHDRSAQKDVGFVPECQNRQRASGNGLAPLAEGASQLQTNFWIGIRCELGGCFNHAHPVASFGEAQRLFPHTRVAVAQCGNENLVAQCTEAVERARGLQAGEGIFPRPGQFLEVWNGGFIVLPNQPHLGFIPHPAVGTFEEFRQLFGLQ